VKILFIGGTGTISSAITKTLLEEGNHQLYLINRGNRNGNLPANVQVIQGDIHNEAEIQQKLTGLTFDVVADFIAFDVSHVERDFRLFKDKTNQFIFISSASAYQKPLNQYQITESTPLCNPFWEYSRKKIACENYLLEIYREHAFPVTIIRPSHTYDERSVPLGVHGKHGSWQVIERMRQGKPVIVHGDGTALWTMTHNSDFAQGFIGILGNPKAIGEAIQITSDESVTWNQIYTSIAKALKVPFNPYYVPSDFLAAVSTYDFEGSLIGDKANTVVFDNAKLKRLVPSFRAAKTFDRGVAETIQYILEHPEYQISDPEFDVWCDRVIEEMEKAKKALREK
jgi:nucleoside-diphosphate-sugar epimerase